MYNRLMATVIVKSVERKGISVNGNPSYWIEFVEKDSSVLKGYTASNAQCGYIASNLANKFCKIEYHNSKKGSIIIDTMEEV